MIYQSFLIMHTFIRNLNYMMFFDEFQTLKFMHFTKNVCHSNTEITLVNFSWKEELY